MDPVLVLGVDVVVAVGGQTRLWGERPTISVPVPLETSPRGAEITI